MSLIAKIDYNEVIKVARLKNVNNYFEIKADTQNTKKQMYNVQCHQRVILLIDATSILKQRESATKNRNYFIPKHMYVLGNNNYYVA